MEKAMAGCGRKRRLSELGEHVRGWRIVPLDESVSMLRIVRLDATVVLTYGHGLGKAGGAVGLQVIATGTTYV